MKSPNIGLISLNIAPFPFKMACFPLIWGTFTYILAIRRELLGHGGEFPGARVRLSRVKGNLLETSIMTSIAQYFSFRVRFYKLILREILRCGLDFSFFFLVLRT